MVHRLVAAASLSGVFLLSSFAIGSGEDSSRGRSDGLIVFSCFGCPDGREPGGLSTIRPDGSKLRNVPGTLGDEEPAWAPNGRTLAVTRVDGIWIRAATGSPRQQVTLRHPHGVDASPSWSPDGRQIVFLRGTPKEAAGGLRLGLWRVAATGGKPRPLLLEPSGTGRPEWSLGDPDWSPDGRRIAFSASNERLAVIRADGTNRRLLGPRTLRGRDPHWSPDGRRIAFLEFRESGRPNRFRILDLPSGRVRTVFTSKGSVQELAWSPDGRRLAVMATQLTECEAGDPSDECERLGLWIVDAVSGRRTMIYSIGQAGGDVSGIDWRP